MNKTQLLFSSLQTLPLKDLHLNSITRSQSPNLGMLDSSISSYQRRIHHNACEVSSAMPSTRTGPLQGTPFCVRVFIFLTEGPQLVYISGPIKLGSASALYLLPYFVRKVFQATTFSDLEYNNDLLMFPSFLTSLYIAARMIF